MLKVLWTAALIGAFAGLITLITAVLFFSENSVSLAALAAVAVGFATIPYCLARAKSALGQLKKPPGETPHRPDSDG